jgi:hypothetical protein
MVGLPESALVNHIMHTLFFVIAHVFKVSFHVYSRY